jgi:hypothetical protein
LAGRAALGLVTRWPEIVIGVGLVFWLLLPGSPRLLAFLPSALVAGMMCWAAHRFWPQWRALRARIRPLLLPLALACGALALVLFRRAWIHEGAGWAVAFWPMPLAAAAGLLAHPRRLARRKSAGLVLAIAIGLLLLAVLFAALKSVAEEPAGFLNGASSWLSEALRAAALGFNVWAMTHVFATLRRNAKEIHVAFFPGQPFPMPPSPGVLAILRHPRMWLVEEWKGTDFLKGRGLDAAALWGTYIALCKPSRLCWRAGVGAVLFFVIFLGLVVANPLVPPVRGVWSTLFDSSLLMISMLVFFALIFLVVDVVRLTAKFVRYQSIGETIWPDRVLPMVDIPRMERVLRDTTDLALLSRRTEAVSKLVILPFIPLLLLALARHDVVDAWAWTWPMVALFMVCFGFLIAMSMQLRSAAEKGKLEVLTRLTKFKLKALGHKDDAAAGYLDSLIQSMERVATGAYSPAWQAEWLKGLAIPTTGYGALEILRSLGVL